MAFPAKLRHASGVVVASLLLSGSLVSAHPYGRNDLAAAGFDYLLPRQCDNPCGIDDQYCCGGGEVCFTSNDIAGCSSADGAGHGVYITTWTQTQTFTSTITTSWPAKETGSGGGGGGGGGGDGTGDCSPSAENEEACGSICCASWQYCAYKGQCLPRDGASSVPVSTYTTNGQLTTQFSQPYRITSTTGASATATGGAGDAEDSTAGTGSKLSGGAIAGIVVGTLAGVALLMLLCFCCVVRGLWAVLCGRDRDKDKERERRRSRSRTVVTEERYARRAGSPHSHREHHRTWYGTRVSSPSDRGRRPEQKKSKFSLWMMAIMSTLAALLFLNRGKNKKKDSEKTRSTTATSRSRGYTDSWTGSESDRSK